MLRHLADERTRRRLFGALAFLVGFQVIVLGSRVIFPALSGIMAEPSGNYLNGVVTGLLSALLAVGLVLIYRTNRIINFAQGSLGGFAATLTAELYQVFYWPYLAAILTGVVAAVLMSMLVEWAVIRRFRNAPRMILTVATIGVAQILGAVELILPYLINTNRDATEFRTSLRSPFEVNFNVGGAPFGADHVIVLLVAPLVLIGLFVFLRYTRYGVAARGIAENRDRARLLGIRVSRVSLIVWGIAGLLSALTAILRAPILGFTFGAIGGVGLLFRALAAAVIGRMESIPITVAAAVLLTIAEQTMGWHFTAGPANAFYLAVIIVALLAQRGRLGRVDPGSSSWQAVHEVRPVPAVMRRLPEVMTMRIAAPLVLLVVALVLPTILLPSDVQLVALLFIYGMIGISLVMLTGWSGHLSLGHWAIVGFGALVAGVLNTQEVPWDFFLTLLIGSLAGAGVALVIGLPALRIRGLFLGITTLALAVAAEQLFFQWEFFRLTEPVRRPVMFGLWDTTSEQAFYYVTLGGLLLALFVGRNIRRSRLGRVQVALRDNETQAQSYGIRPVRMKLVAFAMSGFVAALAGGLYAYNQQQLEPGRFPASMSLLVFSMVVIGGMGSMTGAILGAVYVQGTIYFLPSQFQLLATGFGMLILLLIFPGGLGQIVFNQRDRYLRWVAERRGLIVPSLVADKRSQEEEGFVQTVPPVATTDEEPDLVGTVDRP